MAAALLAAVSGCYPYPNGRPICDGPACHCGLLPLATPPGLRTDPDGRQVPDFVDTFTWQSCGDVVAERWALTSGPVTQRYFVEETLVYQYGDSLSWDCGELPPEVATCQGWCLYFDHWAGTDQAELPPGDPGWCQDSPWKDFVYEP